MVFLWWQSVAEGYDYAVVIMIVISNHCWMESECVISAAQTAPEWLSALDGSNGGRFETQAFCWHKHWQMHAVFLQADNLTFSAGGSTGRWGSWITSTAFQRGAALWAHIQHEWETLSLIFFHSEMWPFPKMIGDYEQATSLVFGHLWSWLLGLYYLVDPIGGSTNKSWIQHWHTRLFTHTEQH